MTNQSQNQHPRTYSRKEMLLASGAAMAVGVAGTTATVELNKPNHSSYNHEAVAISHATPSASQTAKEIKPGQTKVTVSTKPSVKATSKRPASTQTSASKAPVETKAEMQKPLSPRGGDYNDAENAAYSATQGDFDTAETLLAKLHNPSVKAAAEHAVQVAYAEEAAYDTTNSEIDTAESLLSHITLPDVRAKAQTAINYGIAEEAAYDATNNDDYATAKSLEGKITSSALVANVEKAIAQEKSNSEDAINTWSNLNDEATNQWSGLNDQATAEWDNLYLHSDEYWQQYEQAPDK